MKPKYIEGHPVAEINVKGPKGEREYAALIDTGAFKTLIPRKDCLELGLMKVTERTVIGVCKEPVDVEIYQADVYFLDKKVLDLVVGFDLPEEEGHAKIFDRSVIGRDILNRFDVNLEAKRGRIEIKDP